MPFPWSLREVQLCQEQLCLFVRHSCFPLWPNLLAANHENLEHSMEKTSFNPFHSRKTQVTQGQVGQVKSIVNTTKAKKPKLKTAKVSNDSKVLGCPLEVFIGVGKETLCESKRSKVVVLSAATRPLRSLDLEEYRWHENLSPQCSETRSMTPCHEYHARNQTDVIRMH